MKNYSDAWEQSYKNRDNHIFYPKEEVVRFLSRFVRKRTGLNEFRDVLDFSDKVRGLDYGCGIGRHTILMREFGLEAYGLDISSHAVATARQQALFFGFKDMLERFVVSDGMCIPFQDNYFDITVCEAVLDSMIFDLARKDLAEMARVTKRYLFVSLIAGERAIEELVQTAHEHGTIQCYYDEQKVLALIEGIPLQVKQRYLLKELCHEPAYERGRYYLILEKKGSAG
jgi:ubiquinone/menaquinone biosynthesis C-methylase UbiE